MPPDQGREERGICRRRRRCQAPANIERYPYNTRPVSPLTRDQWRCPAAAHSRIDEVETHGSPVIRLVARMGPTPLSIHVPGRSIMYNYTTLHSTPLSSATACPASAKRRPAPIPAFQRTTHTEEPQTVAAPLPRDRHVPDVRVSFSVCPVCVCPSFTGRSPSCLFRVEQVARSSNDQSRVAPEL